jgi:Fic family protein
MVNYYRQYNGNYFGPYRQFWWYMAIWKPKYTITNSIAGDLTRIEAARVVVETAGLPPAVLAELSRQARIRATHFSTRIEGNRLTLEEAEEVIAGRRRDFHGRERDVVEVRNYWDALTRVEEWGSKQRPVSEDLIKRLAGIVTRGKRSGPAPYRDGQNVIRDPASGRKYALREDIRSYVDAQNR